MNEMKNGIIITEHDGLAIWFRPSTQEVEAATDANLLPPCIQCTSISVILEEIPDIFCIDITENWIGKDGSSLSKPRKEYFIKLLHYDLIFEKKTIALIYFKAFLEMKNITYDFLENHPQLEV